MIESLAASGAPAGVAASLRSLRIAYAEHGAPDAGRIAAAVDASLHVDDDEVHREAMATLLGICDADKPGIGRMIKTLAMRRQACRPVLMARTLINPPFNAAERIDCIDVCIDGASPDNAGIVYTAYSSLAALAGKRPDDVVRLLARLAGQGAYIDNRAGRVIAELGRADPRKASDAILSMLRRSRGAGLDEHLPSMLRHAAKFSEAKAVAAPILAALDPNLDAPYYAMALRALKIAAPQEMPGPAPPNPAQ